MSFWTVRQLFFFYRRFVRRLFWQLERALESFAVVKGWPRGGY